MPNQMAPLDLADSLRELCLEFKNDLNLIQIHLDDLAKMAAQIEALQVTHTDDPHWLEYPTDHRLVTVSGEFGVMFTVGGKTWMHEGIDISVRIGTPIYAAADGRVVLAGVKDGYGYCVRLEHLHNGAKWWTWYGHLSLVSVMASSLIKAGELIGLSGATGNVTGPHLHFGVQSETSDFLGAGWAETLRGSMNPRDWLRWPV